MKENRIDLTEGVIWKQLLIFVWPILLANIFEQLYNVTNSLIVGNYIDTIALSAVSATNSITLLTQFFYYGLAMASGVLVANFYGADLKHKVARTIETSFLLALIVGTACMLLIEVFTPQLMQLSNIDETIFEPAKLYLRIIILADMPIFLYNVCFFILRSLGNSKDPLNYLIISSVLNIILGVLFVRVFNWGIVGVGLATIISRVLIDILAIRLLLRIDPDICIDLRHLHIDFDLMKRIFALGVPAAVQNMLIAISNFIVQAYINMFSYEIIAGIGVANKVVLWVQMPMQGISTIGTNYVGQNLGARKYDRVKEGIRFCNWLATAITFVLALGTFIWADDLVRLFDKDPLVVIHGAAATRFMVFSFVPLTWSHIYNGCCRGAGNVRVPMIIAVMSQCVAKYLFVTIGLKISFNIVILYLAPAIGFSLAGIFASIYFHTSSWVKEAHLR